VPVAISSSTVDSLEHLNFKIPETGLYSIEISSEDAIGLEDEVSYGLSWNLS